ncbi:hypothetical protein MTR_6g008940 [Medicago truncatula]|uniref:Uncharacterized protein n=1 Tax=Medicago truncatula TaxID=3880 RepID=G7KJW9_MEDTR|nr:hypothetical protein MTR_6g008940 [Medicago truncatula]
MVVLDLHWLSPLSSLKYLNLGFSTIDLHKKTNWVQVVSTLPSLLELRLNDYNLNNFPSIEYLNLSSIRSYNGTSSLIMVSLVHDLLIQIKASTPVDHLNRESRLPSWVKARVSSCCIEMTSIVLMLLMLIKDGNFTRVTNGVSAAPEKEHNTLHNTH